MRLTLSLNPSPKPKPNPSRRKALAVFAAAAAVAGCTLNRAGVRRGESLLGQFGGNGNARVIEPKRCFLEVVILPRPLHDKVINERLWGSADEQVVTPEARRALEANGLRLGLLTGGLPAEVEAAIHAPPPDKIDPSQFDIPDGSNSLVSLAESTPSASLLINRDGRAFGKDYKDVSGWLRVTASHDGPTGVALRFVPELHHGQIQRRFDAVPNQTGTPSSMQFLVKDGQQEETLRELVAGLTLQPGQVAAVGCLPDRPGSLGAFLFTKPEANSDRLTQKVLLVWARRTQPGIPGSNPSPKPALEPVEPPDLPTPAPRTKDARPSP
jgi:hypothetical protein